MGLSRGVCLLCQKCTLICLVRKTCLKFSLYLVLNEKFQYGHKDDLRNSLSNTAILKFGAVYHNQSCDPPRGLEAT
jgi:hypothetical protein